jgi:hypothetical protein
VSFFIRKTAGGLKIGFWVPATFAGSLKVGFWADGCFAGG